MINIIQVLALSVSLGFTMKTADLLDEHGLKWFKGSTILFGILWGVSMSLLLLADQNALVMFWLATSLTYIIKAQIDYFNHGIAMTIILLTFLWNIENITIDWPALLYFFITIGVTGLLNKYVIEKYNVKNFIGKLFKWRTHYNLITLLFSIYTNIWIVFISRMLFWIAYEITTYYGIKKIENQKTNKLDNIA